MAVKYRNLDECSAFAGLVDLPSVDLRRAFTPERFRTWRNAYDLPNGDWLRFNYAARPVSDEIIAALAALAEEQELIAKYREIASGAVMNTGENRMVLHHLCRGEPCGPVTDENRDYGAFYREQQARISAFARDVHSGVRVSPAGEPFEAAVQVGIGGSDLGPRALFIALQGHEYVHEGTPRRGPLLETRFISNVDPDDAASALSGLNPKTTLFILVSKSGTTQETLTNEALVLDWLSKAGVASPRKQIICVTSETSPLAQSDDYLESFFIDDYVGGRYSSSSAVGGAVLSLAYGPEVFAELLAGAAAADIAALRPGVRDNPALLDALIGVYERNVLGYPATAVLPYSQALLRFPAHLQQLDMESNGKRVSRDGSPVSYGTGPIVFGEPGTNGQHSFYQLLHQGTDIVPLQFVGFEESQLDHDIEWGGSTSQAKLNANLAAQIVAFATGKPDTNSNREFPGGRPSSLLTARRLTPAVLGAILAHYENKVMFQGLIWNINSFDQEGVQLGKRLTKQILAEDDNRDPLLEAVAAEFGL